MAIKSSFLDNKEYGASDVNAIISRIVGQGVQADYTAKENGVSYNLSMFNDLTKAYVKQGVAYSDDSSLKVVEINGGYYVQPGLCFFGNGSTTEVTEREPIELSDGDISYIYMISDMPNNTNYIAVSEECPNYNNDSNIVPLASVDSSGNITDMRFYARGKLPGYQIPAVNVKEIVIDSSMASNEYADIDLGVTAFSFIAALSGSFEYSQTVSGLAAHINLADNGKIIRINASAPADISETDFAFEMHAYYVGNTRGYAWVTSITYLSGTTWRFKLKFQNKNNLIGRKSTLIYV